MVARVVYSVRLAAFGTVGPGLLPSRTDNVLRNLGTIVEGGYRGQAMISLKASITIKLERVKRSISLTEMTVGMSALANNNY